MVRKTTRKNKTPFSKKAIKRLTKRSGLYQLFSGKKTVYVGKSKDTRRRLNEHINEGKKKATHFKITYMPAKKAEKKENRVIRDKKPKYNKRKY